MEQWKGKIAVVTGVNSGLGFAIAKDLCRHGVIVVGLDMNTDRAEELQKAIKKLRPSAQCHVLKCNLTKEEDIVEGFDYAIKTYGGVDILINNAGFCRKSAILDEGNLELLKTIIETNVLGVISCTKKAFKSMADRDVPGYIINVSSVGGHVVPYMPNTPGLNVYSPTKHAVTALGTVLRHELNFFKKPKIRVSNISPGGMLTNIMGSEAMMRSAPMELPLMDPAQVSNAIMYMLSTDPKVQIQDLIIRHVSENAN